MLKVTETKVYECSYPWFKVELDWVPVNIQRYLKVSMRISNDEWYWIPNKNGITISFINKIHAERFVLCAHPDRM